MDKPVRPDWLPPEAYSSFEAYGSGAREAWAKAQRYYYQSLSETHHFALMGDPYALATMRDFFINLTTRRLKR